MNRKLIVVLLATLGLTAGSALADPTGVSSPGQDARTPIAAPSQSSPRRSMEVAEAPLARSGRQPEVTLDTSANTDFGRSETQPARARRNGQHPAVLSHSHPVYPIGVPLPPVSLERY